MNKKWPQGVHILIGEIKIHCAAVAIGQYEKSMPNVIKQTGYRGYFCLRGLRDT